MFKRGFTLIELIVVIAIIAVLAAIVAPAAFRTVEKAKISGTVADWKSIKTAAMAFYADVGSWAGNCSGTANCAAGDFFSTTGGGWDGPYLDKWPNGRWGTGEISWNTTSAGNLFGTSTGERYITVSQIPSGTIQDKIDLAIDGGTVANLSSGSCRLINNNLTILISRDGPVN